MTYQTNTYDALFIGGGLSALYSLVGFLDSLQTGNMRARSINLGIVDKNGDFGCGLPYGSKATDGLTLLPAQYMAPGLVENPFVEFLSEDSYWLDLVRKSSSPALQYWYECNRVSLLAGDFADIHFPRMVFGMFTRQLFETTIAKLGFYQVHVQLVKADIHDIVFRKDKFICQSKDATFEAGHVILGLGSLLRDVIMDDGTLKNFQVLPDQQHYIAALNGLSPENRRILIIGSNAAAAEAIYRLGTNREIMFEGGIDVVSPSGLLPEAMTSGHAEYVPHHVLHFNGTDAQDLWGEILADYHQSRIDGFSTYDITDGLRRAVKSALSQLSQDEQQYFADIYSPQLLGITRSSGPEYRSISDHLLAAKKLKVINGIVRNISFKDGIYHAALENADGHIVKKNYGLVLNCSGPSPLREAGDSLIANLVEKNLVSITSSGKGIQVDKHFQAAPHLYVMGPLLAGNRLNGEILWHLESSWKIAEMAPALGRHLSSQIYET